MASRASRLAGIVLALLLLAQAVAAAVEAGAAPAPAGMSLLQPAPSATPSPSPAGTPTLQATPTATPTPLATPTATPVLQSASQGAELAGAPAAGGSTAISPDNAAGALPGATVSYTHTVTHLGSSFDVKNVTAVSSLGWPIALFEADGTTPLSDHNSDGIPDTGRVNSGQSRSIVLKVTVPGGATTGLQDVTTVTASSGRNPTPANSASATDTTTVLATPTPTPTIPGVTPPPTHTPTPTPTGTPVPPSGTTDISPDQAQVALPGATASYTHTVTHLGSSFDVKNVTATSSQGWQIGLFEADGTTPLTDHNSDGIPDTGRIDSGQSKSIVVKVTVPSGAAAALQEVTTVTANSGRNPAPSNSDTATDTTTVAAVLRLSLSTSNVTFGLVSPVGEVDPVVGGLTSSTDEQGAYYVKQGALRVEVSSNGPWNGSWQAAENRGSAASLRVADGDLEWRVDGGEWTAFITANQSWPFANPASGSGSYSFDYRLRVLWADDPGGFDSAISVMVSR
ncbi:MAG: hypothetical protein ACYC5J_13315 [Chloroflexota bacterium]